MALTSLKDNPQIDKDLDEFSATLEKLRLAYEQYFLGLDKKEPLKLREKVVGFVRKYSTAAIQNARLKFRYTQTVARYNTFTTYWDRVLHEMEEGRYERDVFKARLHEQERMAKKSPPKSEAQKPAQPAADPMATLFQQYVDARRKCNEPTQGLSLQSFSKALQVQVEAIKKKGNIETVRFQVAMEGGKTKLKAVPVLKK